jgi:hypothetical protein
MAAALDGYLLSLSGGHGVILKSSLVGGLLLVGCSEDVPSDG